MWRMRRRTKEYLIQSGKATLATYAVIGTAMWWDETSPLGWWNLKPRTKEEKEMASRYEHREFPYPGDKEAVREFVEKGGTYGTTIGSQSAMKGPSDDIISDLQREKFERESRKLWLRMRREVLQEFEERGYNPLDDTETENGVKTAA